MNTALLTEIRDWILTEKPASHGFEFDMQMWVVAHTTDNSGHWCGTTCCIAGAALLFSDPDYISSHLSDEAQHYGEDEEITLDEGIENLAAEALGLPLKTAEQLFNPWSAFMELNLDSHQPPEHVARVIDHLIETGEVNWTI